MKYIYLLLTVIVISACSKDDIGPMGLKHGQEVEAIIDHRYEAIDDRPLLLPNREPAEYRINGFNGREPRYTYKVKARVHLDRSDPAHPRRSLPLAELRGSHQEGKIRG